jgi:formate hydrogenlyase regulatory protein HycA
VAPLLQLSGSGHHPVESASSPRDELCGAGRYALCPLRPFHINVTLADNFNSHTIEYYVETKDGEKQCIAKAQLMADGMVDGHVSNRDRQQVLEHYLEKIAPVYNGLYTAVEHDLPVNLKQLMDGNTSANVA